MIIGIDGHMIGDRSGGNENYYTNILMNMDTGDDEVILFVKKGTDVSVFRDKFRIVEFENDKAFFRIFFEIPRLCKKYNLDVMHMQYFIPFFRPCPIVCTIHDICFEHYSDIFTKKEYFRQKLLIPYAAKKSRAIFTVSNHAKADITDKYKVASDKVYVTYNSVDDSFKKLSSEELNETELRERYGLGTSRIVLTVGNLQPRKNLPRLIRAFAKLSEVESFADTSLVIVGKKAWITDEIFAEACKHTDKVILTDYVTKEDLIRLYNVATCFIYPSFFEGFGIPPLEAMACGTPVAVSSATSLPEVVGNAGLFFDPFSEDEMISCMRTLLEDGESVENVDRHGAGHSIGREDLIILGHEQVKKFSWAESAKTIMDVYHLVGDRH